MNELIGFSRPNDFSNIVLRAELSRRYGIFGRIPMWGGIMLHEFYPPLSTVIARILTMNGVLLFYLIATFVIWTLARGPLVAILFLLSFYHYAPALHAGRYPEFLGYSLVTLAILVPNNIIAGILLGLAGLSYPLPLILGGIILIWRSSPILFLAAFLVCGWWYIPFFLKSNKLAYLKEKRRDKVFGLYAMQYGSIINLLFFLFLPLWACFIAGVLIWLVPVSFNTPHPGIRLTGIKEIRGRLKMFFCMKPFFMSDLLKRLPRLEQVQEEVILIRHPDLYPGVKEENDEFRGSMMIWVWASAAYLIKKGVIVYNGLPSTEIAFDHLTIPSDLKVYSLSELGFLVRG